MQNKIQFPDFVKITKDIGSLDTLIRYHPLYYRRALRIIRKFEHAGMSERKELADKLRDRALRRAMQTVYGKQFRPDFECWPTLEKTTLRDNSGVCSTWHFPTIRASTGGTTGLPIKLLRSLECIAAEQAFIDNLILGHGLDFRSARISVLRADEIKGLGDDNPPFGVLRNNGKRLVLSNAHMSKHTIEWFVSALKEFRPQVLWVYPSMLANMISLMDTAQLKFQVPFILSSSESMESGLFRTAEDALSAKVIDYYGQGERACFAYATQPEEYWFSPAYGHVELLLQEDGAIENGTRTAQIIATGYWNSAMPLIRYNTGDLAIIPSHYTEKDLEEVVLGIKPFLGIAGRSNEFIITEDGRNIGGLNHLPREVEHILRLQVIQESLDHVVIKVLAAAGFNDHDRSRILTNARGMIPPEVGVTIDVVDSLEVAVNGKTPFVIRRLPESSS